MNNKILIVDDDRNTREGLAQILRKSEYEVLLAKDGREALDYLKTSEVDLVLTDLVMPKSDGMEILRMCREIRPQTLVILLTAYGTIEKAVQAMKMGTEDFITKPINVDELKIVIKRAFEKKKLLEENVRLKERISEKFGLFNIVGHSRKMREIFQTVKQIAPSDATILIQGESGTGKELIADAIHELSPRKAGPMLKFSCASLSEGVLESELFGHEKGAFTGAVARKKGRFELAHGGTIFLDEIGEMSPAVQLKLLRVLQDGEFQRVGGTETIRVDVRLIAATNADLEALIREKRFREDLYYRLNVVSLRIPPLRERREDIPLLVNHFLRKYSVQNRKDIDTISSKAMALLMQYSWPGNVRELENCIESAVVMTRGNTILPERLPSYIVKEKQEELFPIKLGSSMEEIEKEAILRTLEYTKGNKTKTAQILGIGLRTIHAKLKEYKAH